MTETDPPETLSQRAARLAKEAAASSSGESLSARAARLAKAQQPSEMPEPEISYPERLATSVLNAAQGIPGMEAVEAKAGQLGSHLPGNTPMSYHESLDALRGNVSKMSTGARVAGRMLGSVAVAPFLPANPAAAGAVLGGADQALSADPIHDAGDVAMRVGKTALGATAGAVIGKTLQTAPTAIRAFRTPTPGANALGREAEMAATDAHYYGQASQEAARAGGTSPAIKAALDDPVVKPFADKVRVLDQFKTATDAEVLAETYKQMGEYERRLGTTITNATDFLPTKAAQEQHIRLGKSRMLNAADPTMPTFRQANTLHAAAEGDMDALETGVDAARRLMKGSLTPPKKLDTKSPEAIRQLLESLPADQRQVAEQGILGELRTSARLRGPTKGFGAGPFLTDAARVAPLLEATATPAQRAIDALVRAGIVTGNATGAGTSGIDDALDGGRRLFNGRSR